MISDEERREVARRLREIREDEYGEVYMYDVMLALGIESGKAAYWADQEFIHHLADLVDRPTCTVESVIYRDSWEEYEVQLSCGHEIITTESADGLAFCQYCGAEVVPDGC